MLRTKKRQIVHLIAANCDVEKKVNDENKEVKIWFLIY